MLTVIIDGRAKADRLPALLAQLTPGAVDGIVRQVAIVAPAGAANLDLICEETGAEAHPTLKAAAQAARYERLLVLPADFRFRDGWIGALGGHLARGGGDAVVAGLRDGGPFSRPLGVLVQRGLLEQGVDDPQLDALRRRLGFAARRIG
jgi:hypothetical protein